MQDLKLFTREMSFSQIVDIKDEKKKEKQNTTTQSYYKIVLLSKRDTRHQNKKN